MTRAIMTPAITYTLWLEEPCLLAAPGGDPNTESSLDYIPGGAMRGALAAAYLRDGGDDTQFTTLFLNGRVRFLNAYPDLDGRTLPPPRAWAMKKDDERTVYNRLVTTAREEVEKDLPQGFKTPFIRPLSATADGEVWSAKIEHEIAVHTARNRPKGRAIEGDSDSALFRYRALARGQRFTGAVVLDEDLTDDEMGKVVKLLKGAKLTLGGSHMAGYGLTQVEDVTPHEQWREGAGPPPAVAAGESFIVYLTAPTILYDPRTGQPTGSILPFLPGNAADCDKTYTIQDSYAGAGWVGGFNKHRGLPLSQQWAVQMGSTWRVTTTRAISAGELRALEHSGIGVRREEGFGRVLFGPQWPGTLAKRENSSQSIQVNPPAEAKDATSPVGEALLTQMNKRLAQGKLDRLLTVAVNNKAQPDNIRGHLSRSQFGRLMVRIRQEPQGGKFMGFIHYLEGTKQRKSADDQFRKYTVEHKNFRDFLRELAEEPHTVWDKIGATPEKMPHIGLVAYDFRAESAGDSMAHHYTVRYISELCRRLAKLEVGQ